jgi:hypothetical protein
VLLSDWSIADCAFSQKDHLHSQFDSLLYATRTMTKSQVVQGTTSKFGGFVLLMATFFSLLGSGMEWLQTDYTEPVAVNATKAWDTTQPAVPTDGAPTPNLSTGDDWTEGLDQTRSTDGLDAGKFTLVDQLDNQIGHTDAKGAEITSEEAEFGNYQVEVDSSLWNYCAPATGGVRTFKVTAGGGGDAVAAADAYEVHQEVFSVDCRAVADMGAGFLKDRLMAAQAFSILTVLFGLLATLASFSDNAKCMGKVGVQYIAITATFSALVTICTVSCSSGDMYTDGMCVFPYASLISNEQESQFPGLGMICEVFACLFFFIGGIVSCLGAKASKSDSTFTYADPAAEAEDEETYRMQSRNAAEEDV